MNKILLLLMSFSFAATSTTAQLLKDILTSQTVKDIVTTVTGGKDLTVDNIEGTWVYQNPAVKLEDEDNTLKNVVSSVATSEIEKKLEEYCEKIGIKEGLFNYVFNTDGSFTSKYKNTTLKGTYTLDSEGNTISLKYTILGKSLLTLDADVVLSGEQLTILFNVDKLLDFLSTVSSISSSSALEAIDSLVSSYDNLKAGFFLQKQ